MAHGRDGTRSSGGWPSRTSKRPATVPAGLRRRQRARRVRLARGRPAPRLRHARTFQEAMRLHEVVDRPNLMVKIPATKPGLAAIEDVIAKGRSINVTLIFSLRRYAEVAESYQRGLERLIAEGGDPATSPRWRASSSRGSTPRPKAPRGARRAEQLEASSRWRTRSSPTALQGGLLGPPLGIPGLEGGDPPAGAVGVDLDQEPGLPGHALRGRADRPRYGQHDARGNDPAYQDHGDPQPRLELDLDEARASCSTSWPRRGWTTRTSPTPSSARASRSSRTPSSSCWRACTRSRSRSLRARRA